MRQRKYFHVPKQTDARDCSLKVAEAFMQIYTLYQNEYTSALSAELEAPYGSINEMTLNNLIARVR